MEKYLVYLGRELEAGKQAEYTGQRWTEQAHEVEHSGSRLTKEWVRGSKRLKTGKENIHKTQEVSSARLNST